MKDVLKANIDKLESSFELWERSKSFYIGNESKIFTTLKRNLEYDMKVKKERNFSYIYYDISNLDKLFEGNLKVLNEGTTQLYSMSNGIKYIKEYLLLLDNTPFIIKVEQDLYTIGVFNKKREIIKLPIFRIDELLYIYVTENGVTRSFFYNTHKDNMELDSEIMKEALEDIRIKICNTSKDKISLRAYYNQKLELERSGVDKYIFSSLKDYLRQKYNEDEISDNVTLKQETRELVLERLINKFQIKLKYITPSYIESENYIWVNTSTKKVMSNLFGPSFFIIMERLESSLINKEMKLSTFIYEILAKSNKNILVAAIYSNNRKNLLSCNKKVIPKLNSIEDDKIKVKLNFEAINNICYPTSVNIYECEPYENNYIASVFNQELIEEKIFFYEDSKVALAQYYLVNVLSEEGFKYFVFKFFFKFNKFTFNYNKKDYSVVVPCFEISNKLELFDNDKVKLIQSYIGNDNVYSYLNYVSDLKILDTYRGMNKKCILKAYPEIEEESKIEVLFGGNLFSNEDITFCTQKKYNKSNFDFSKVNLNCSEILDKEDIYRIKLRYNVKR